MQKEAINDDVRKYLDCVARIQWHLRFIENLYTGQPPALHEPSTELIFLHFRKALEELAFSSLCANVDKYSMVYDNFNKHGQWKNILIAISRLNPHFFPIPVPQHTYSPHTSEPPTHDPVTGDDGCLSRADMELLFRSSSRALHTQNPYKQESDVDLKYSVPEWIQRFRKLLRVHFIQLVDNEEVWTVTMPDEGLPGVGVSRLVPILVPTREG